MIPGGRYWYVVTALEVVMVAQETLTQPAD
jgi:hypothetical protein